MRSPRLTKSTANCCEKVYIGQTKRNLKKRLYEHNRQAKNFDIEKSALARQYFKTAYNFDQIELLKCSAIIIILCLWI